MTLEAIGCNSVVRVPQATPFVSTTRGGGGWLCARVRVCVRACVFQLIKPVAKAI